MNATHATGRTLLLAGLLCAAPALAADPGAPPARGLAEIPDVELGTMRGRFTVGDNRVLWFGVSMISSWHTSAGQALQGRLDMGFDFSSGDPAVTFAPNVVLADESAPMQAPAGHRTVDPSGLANVSGLVQGIQVAGDGNAAGNTASLAVREGEAPARPAAGQAGPATAASGPASASVRFDHGSAGVLLQVDGHGVAEQWIRAGSMGQSIRLTSDGQAVSNQLHMDLVRQALPAAAMLNQSVAQALGAARGIGGGP